MAKKRKRKEKSQTPVTRRFIRQAPTVLEGGRLTTDRYDNVFASSYQVLAPIAPDEIWRSYGLDANTLSKLPVADLIALLIDISPDVSKAAWDWQRLFNPGFEVHAYNESGAINEEAEQSLWDFLNSLCGPYAEPNRVPVDIVINMLSMGGFLYGGLFAELVLDEAGKMPVDIATPNPITVRFRRVDDPTRGRVWQLGQDQGLYRNTAAVGTAGAVGFVPMTRETVVYVPIDPLPGSPFGRPLIYPAVFATLFLIGLLHDLRRVVAQQGYPRLDLIIDAEKLHQLMPTTLEGDEEAVQAWFNTTFDEIKAAYCKLQPDDAYVHYDAVTVNAPIGATDSSLSGIDGLIKSLERMLIKALKTMPLMMAAENASVSQANANRQWEIQAAGIKAIQHLLEFLLEKLMTLALEAQGITAKVVWRFAELRASELLRDEQVRMLRIKNARAMYDNGTLSADEMAAYSTSDSVVIVKAQADSQEPRAPIAKAAAPSVGTLPAEPGSERGIAVAQWKMLRYAQAAGMPGDPERGLSEMEKEKLTTWAKRQGFTNNATAQALLFTSALIPSQAEMEEAERWFNEEVPDADGVLAAEVVQ